LLAIHSMGTTPCFRGVVRSAIFRGDSKFKAGPQATTGLGGRALSYQKRQRIHAAMDQEERC
jgi:hypothetical protein